MPTVDPPDLSDLIPSWAACVCLPLLAHVDYAGVLVGVAMTFAHLCGVLWYHDLGLRRCRAEGEGED